MKTIFTAVIYSIGYKDRAGDLNESCPCFACYGKTLSNSASGGSSRSDEPKSDSVSPVELIS